MKFHDSLSLTIFKSWKVCHVWGLTFSLHDSALVATLNIYVTENLLSKIMFKVNISAESWREKVKPQTWQTFHDLKIVKLKLSWNFTTQNFQTSWKSFRDSWNFREILKSTFSSCLTFLSCIKVLQWPLSVFSSLKQPYAAFCSLYSLLQGPQHTLNELLS